jgi:CheY-like chemotaxis protein
MRVLVVEDEALIKMMLLDMLEELGHKVTAAVSIIPEAMQQLQQDRPDVVLLDVNLSGELSYEVANHCTVEGIPVILTTAYTAADVPEGLSHCPVLAKPFSMDALRDAIARIEQKKP